MYWWLWNIVVQFSGSEIWVQWPLNSLSTKPNVYLYIPHMHVNTNTERSTNTVREILLQVSINRYNQFILTHVLPYKNRSVIQQNDNNNNNDR